jgi:hypothetical protein
MARHALQFLKSRYENVYANSGTATAFARREWGLQKQSEKKERTDHTHHVIDALVIAALDRDALNQISYAYHDERPFCGGKLALELTYPWATFPEDVYNADIISAENSGVAPCIWGDPSITMIDNHVAYTSSFYVSDRYFAFEMEGFLDDGITTDEGYVVALQYTNGGIIASMSGNPDGSGYRRSSSDCKHEQGWRWRILRNEQPCHFYKNGTWFNVQNCIHACCFG